MGGVTHRWRELFAFVRESGVTFMTIRPMSNGTKVIGFIAFFFILRGLNIVNFEGMVYLFFSLLVILTGFIIDKIDWEARKKKEEVNK